MKITFYIILLSLAFTLRAQAPITIGQTHEIESSVLGETRQIMVALPDDYSENTDDQYPVLYLLDAETNFHHTTACVQFLARNRRIPKMIVVGLVNSEGNRTRDLTPMSTAVDRRPGSGGADQTYRFMEEELFAWVADRFRTEEYRLLIGHSFGGLFVIHGLINHPELFNSYLAISPSLWWDNQELVKNQAETFLKNNAELTGHLYMTMGDEGGQMAGGGWKLSALLEESAGPNFLWHYEVMEEENHGTVPYRSTRQGLEFIFDQWNWDSKRRALRAEGISAIKYYDEEVELLYGLSAPWDKGDMMQAAQGPFDRGKTEQALQVYQLTTEKFPNFSAAWQMLGECQLIMDLQSEAAQSLKKALQIDPDNVAVNIALKKLQLGEEALYVSSKNAASYVGSYDMDAGMVIEVLTNDNKLQVKTAQTEIEDLFPLGEHTFFLSTRQAKIIFELEDDVAQNMKVETPDGTMLGMKIKE
ncbi:MAG: alpha/beta hydrolase-fold protein [Bacteroidota bacterium]